MSPTRVLPNAEAVAIGWLLTSLDIEAIVDDRIYSEPIENAVRPFLTVQRISGRTDVHHWIDHPTLQIGAWSKDRVGVSGRDEAHTLCELAVVWLLGIDMNQPDAVVTDVTDVTGAVSRPDPITGNPRFIADVAMTLHPLADQGS